jgi:ribosomal protein S18 acetylase RimI-like enzyme
VSRDALELQRLGAEADEHLRPALAEWILDAGNPHLEWLYLGDRERALRAIASSLASERSELWAGHVTALFDGGRPIGGFVALRGAELPDRRRADLLTLIRSTPREDRAEVRDRIALGKDLYLPVEPEHRFLSKIGVLADHRGRGFGGALLDAFIRSSWDEGDRTIRLDVRGDDERAVGLYRSRGFEPIASARLDALDVEYVAMILTRPGHAN